MASPTPLLAPQDATAEVALGQRKPSRRRVTPKVCDDPSAVAPLLAVPHVAANMMGTSIRSLERWRLNGGGPPFIYITPDQRRVAYPIDELKAWIAGRLVRSTSEATVKTGKAA